MNKRDIVDNIVKFTNNVFDNPREHIDNWIEDSKLFLKVTFYFYIQELDLKAIKNLHEMNINEVDEIKKKLNNLNILKRESIFIIVYNQQIDAIRK